MVISHPIIYLILGFLFQAIGDMSSADPTERVIFWSLLLVATDQLLRPR